MTWQHLSSMYVKATRLHSASWRSWVNVVKKVCLTDADRSRITSTLGTNMFTIEISKNMNHDRQTIKDFVHCNKTLRKTLKRNYLNKLSTWDIRKLKIQIAKTLHETGKTVFEDDGLHKIVKTTRCKAPKILEKAIKPLKWPSLSKHHKTKRLEWAQWYLKTEDLKKKVYSRMGVVTSMMGKMVGHLVEYWRHINPDLGFVLSKALEA